MTTEITFDVLTLDELAPAIAEHFGREQSWEWQKGDLQTGPGVYAWSSGEDDAVVYIGSASSLSKRVGDEQKWIDGHDPETMWEVSVVHLLKRFDARVQWLLVETHKDAQKLERRLIEWNRASVGAAPLVVGWNAKPGSAVSEARGWAQDLWNSRH